MQSNRFIVLTGHLSNYPLSDLVGILRHQRKSGRLLIEYPKGPAMFFFNDGELVAILKVRLVLLRAVPDFEDIDAGFRAVADGLGLLALRAVSGLYQ